MQTSGDKVQTFSDLCSISPFPPPHSRPVRRLLEHMVGHSGASKDDVVSFSYSEDNKQGRSLLKASFSQLHVTETLPLIQIHHDRTVMEIKLLFSQGDPSDRVLNSPSHQPPRCGVQCGFCSRGPGGAQDPALLTRPGRHCRATGTEDRRAVKQSSSAK